MAAPARRAASVGVLVLGAWLAQPLAVPSGRAPAHPPYPAVLADHDGLKHPFGRSVVLAPSETAQEPDVAVAPGGMPRVEPAVTLDPRDPRRVVVATVDYNAENAPRADLYSSQDGGRTFHGPTMWPLAPDTQLSGDPSLAADRDGRLFFSYVEYGRTGTSGAGGIYVARSLDGGRTWARDRTRVATQQLDSSRGRCHFHDRDEITTDPRRGDILVAWTDFDYDGSGACRDGNGPVMLARSTDHGRHFVQSLVSRPDDATVGAMPRVAPDGTVYVAYTRYDSALECPPELSFGVSVVVARSADHGRTFDRSAATPVLCMPYHPNLTLGTYRTYTFPSLEVLPDGSLVIATVVQQQHHSELLVVRSRDGGRTWRAASVPTMSAGAQYQFPRLGLGPRGLLALTYVEQLPGGVFSCVLSTSRDGGAHWSAPLTVSSERSLGTNPSFQGGFDGDYIGVTIGSDLVAHPTWTDIRPSSSSTDVAAENVWTRRVPL